VTPEDRRALIDRLYKDAINRQDAAAAAAFYVVDATNHREKIGREGMRRVFEGLFTAFPDFAYRIEESTTEGDRIVCRVIMTGTHLGHPSLPGVFGGMLAGVPPTGRKVEVLHFHSFRTSGGQITDHSAVRDDLGMLKQLGLITAPGAAPGPRA
jgi:predicted ester cyclase